MRDRYKIDFFSLADARGSVDSRSRDAGSAPVAAYVLGVAGMPDVVTVHPYGVRMRRHGPASTDPVVAAAGPDVITRSPDVAGAGRIAVIFGPRSRRSVVGNVRRVARTAE